jgi:tRNA(Ile)-lysidine synthase
METLGRLSRIAAADKEYLWECAENSYAELEKEPGVLDQQGLVQLAPAVRHRVIMKALQQVGLTQDVTAVHLEAADSILQQTGESKIVEFPNSYKMAVRYGEVAFYCDEAVCNGNYHWNISIEDLMIVNFENALSNDKKLSPGIEKAIAEDNCCKQSESNLQIARFDYDKVAEIHGDAQLELRTRREGDFLSINGGRKKLQDLFVDMKVPKEYRDSIKVAAIGSEILWLPVQPEKGVKRARYSHRCKLDMNTKKCLKLEYDCEI